MAMEHPVPPPAEPPTGPQALPASALQAPPGALADCVRAFFWRDLGRQPPHTPADTRVPPSPYPGIIWLTRGTAQLVECAGTATAAALPAVTLSVFQLTLIMRLVRAEMLEVLRTDYIKFARARGLPDRVVHFGHALKNTLVPVITIAGLQLGGIIAFAIITETVFQWPGMGLLFIQAVQFADIPVMAAYLCLIALIFVVINLAVDLLYFAVDPRLRIERSGGH